MEYLPQTSTGLITESSEQFCGCAQRLRHFILLIFVFTDEEEKDLGRGGQAE